MRELEPSQQPAALVSTGREALLGTVDGQALGVFAVLEKPWRLDDLYRYVASAIIDKQRRQMA